MLGSLHLPWNIDPAVLDARLLPMERQRIVELVRERINTRRPLPYLLGEAFFAGLPFHVDERVLIPRSPIAELIESGFQAWFPDEPPARVLDLCTGSGCIGIATALHLPTCDVDLADISRKPWRWPSRTSSVMTWVTGFGPCSRMCLTGSPASAMT
ncbi:hypothetical protein Q427_27845 [Halomonas sp. BC04]|nr:hypothetical protein Q427_27845 [Halomonas sp. BC04]